MKFISEKCAKLVPYICGEQPQDKKYIKLNTNENPYAPTKSVRNFLDSADISTLRLYPDPENKELRETIADKYEVTINNVFVGNGSDEILSFVFSAFFNGNERENITQTETQNQNETDNAKYDEGNARGNTRRKGIATADITYSFYPVYADYYSVPLRTVPLASDFSINLESYVRLDVEGFIICNPNAPTGMVLKREIIERFIVDNPTRLVVIDEAYVDFCSESVIDLTKKYDNLFVVRTFSKSYSLAGIRCGYCIGNEDLITALNTVKNSFNSYTVNRLTEKIATLAMRDETYFRENIEKVVSARDFITGKLRSIGFNVLPSGSNFIFAESAEISGEKLYKALREKGILVRYFKKIRIDNFVRITIGTMEEMTELFSSIIAIIGEKK